MSNGDTTHDGAEAPADPMIRLDLREFVLAPEFEHLKDAATGEFETCDTITDDAAALERRANQMRRPAIDRAGTRPKPQPGSGPAPEAEV